MFQVKARPFSDLPKQTPSEQFSVTSYLGGVSSCVQSGDVKNVTPQLV